jgi:pSer/pThr/pTyr-binding forkhead associated (FHA) protein
MKFCGECGAKLDPNAPTPNAASQAAASARQTQFLHLADVNAAQPKARLVVIDQSGKEGMSFNLRVGETQCGRVTGQILFEDPYVSPNHCVFKFGQAKLVVTDCGSLNGLYVRVRVEVELQRNDVFRLGRQLLRFEDASQIPVDDLKRGADDDSRLWGTPEGQPFGRILQTLDDGRRGDVRLLRAKDVRLGRENGDITFPTDGFVSASHAILSHREGRVYLRDVGSSNGTYLRVRGQRALAHDDYILIGNQMLHVDLR